MSPTDFPALVFLDFDGVLNSQRFLESNPQAMKLHKARELVFDPDAIARLNTFLDRNPSAVVISSDWRKAYDFDVIRSIMVANGFKHGNKIVGQTPNFDRQPRGREISAWMTARGLRKPFVILDDRSDMENTRPRLVLTDPKIGITPNDWMKAEAIIKKAA